MVWRCREEKILQDLAEPCRAEGGEVFEGRDQAGEGGGEGWWCFFFVVEV